MTTAVSPEATVASAARRRMALATGAAVLAAADLTVKAWAARALSDGGSVDLGALQLRLAFNPGMAFGLGAALPGWLVLGVTGLITLGLAVIAWRTAATGGLALRVGLAAVLAGAVANLIDRGIDGVVTDYLRTGWWPTFNLADTLITSGAALIVLAALLSPKSNSR